MLWSKVLDCSIVNVTRRTGPVQRSRLCDWHAWLIKPVADCGVASGTLPRTNENRGSYSWPLARMETKDPDDSDVWIGNMDSSKVSFLAVPDQQLFVKSPYVMSRWSRRWKHRFRSVYWARASDSPRSSEVLRLSPPQGSNGLRGLSFR